MRPTVNFFVARSDKHLHACQLPRMPSFSMERWPNPCPPKHGGMSRDVSAVEQAARDHVKRFGPDAVEFLLEQAEIADGIGDSESARDWRALASTERAGSAAARG